MGRSRIDVIGQSGNDGLGYDVDKDLADLAIDHPNRNVSLIEIGAKYRIVGTKQWCEITPSFGISKVTYNQLANVWAFRHEWRATK